MGKETVKNTYVLQEDENIGTVQIADEVVAIIASLAATEVEGVSSMAGNITNELMSKVGVKGLTKGVKVEVFNHQVVTNPEEPSCPNFFASSTASLIATPVGTVSSNRIS